MIVKKYNFILVGQGVWGKNYIKTLSTFDDVKLLVANRENWKILVDDNGPDAVIIATPPDSHIEIAAYALEQDIPVIVEKPLALSYDECLVLNEFKSLILINHIHLFSTAFNNVKTSIGSKQITNITSNGFNDTPNRSYSSLLDYGPHDVSMILDILNKMPKSVYAEEIQTNLYKIIMDFGDAKTDSIVGNGKGLKTRNIDVLADGIHIGYNDNERPFNHTLPLTNLLKEFILVLEGKLPDRRFGLKLPLNVMKILTACQKSLNTKDVISL